MIQRNVDSRTDPTEPGLFSILDPELKTALKCAPRTAAAAALVSRCVFVVYCLLFGVWCVVSGVRCVMCDVGCWVLGACCLVLGS